MNSSRIQLKRPSGWFAAGREVQQAATLLSDGAFKLFLWVCLHAGRASGSLCASTPELARALRKTESDIERSIEELIQADVCRLLGNGALEIQDRFWPYERQRQETITGSQTYIGEIRRMFLRPACVRSAFTGPSPEPERGTPTQSRARPHGSLPDAPRQSPSRPLQWAL